MVSRKMRFAGLEGDNRGGGWDRWQESHVKELTHGKASVRGKAPQSPVKGSLTFSENKLPESLGRVEPPDIFGQHHGQQL